MWEKRFSVRVDYRVFQFQSQTRETLDCFTRTDNTRVMQKSKELCVRLKPIISTDKNLHATRVQNTNLKFVTKFQMSVKYYLTKIPKPFTFSKTAQLINHLKSKNN